MRHDRAVKVRAALSGFSALALCVVLVGVAGAGASGTARSLLPYVVNGTAVTVGLPVGDTLPAAEVVCFGVDDCTAVGLSTSGNQETDRGEVATESAGRWTVSYSPAETTDLSSLACPLQGHCVAIGDVDFTTAVILEQSTTGWHRVSVTLPGNPQTLNVLSCPALGACVVVGSTDDNGEAIVVNETPSGWVATSLPTPADAYDLAPNISPTSISCVAAAECVAVGSYQREGQETAPLVEVEQSGVWSVVPVPLPPGATAGGGLNAVVCPAAGACVAGGYEATSYSAHSALIETESATGWTATGNLSPTPNVILKMACAEPGDCAATSVNDTTSAKVAQLVVQEAGNWRVVNATLPSDAAPGTNGSAYFSGVSCAAGGMCEAVGAYSNRRHRIEPLVVTGWNGKWLTEPPALPNLSKNLGSGLGAVACPSRLSCITIGAAATGPYTNTSYVDTETVIASPAAGPRFHGSTGGGD